MKINEHEGIVRQVIDAVNTALADGPCSITHSIELTRAEMDEFMANNPFTGNTGKFYGDDMRGSLLEIQRRETPGEFSPNAPIISFRLHGVLVCVPEGE